MSTSLWNAALAHVNSLPGQVYGIDQLGDDSVYPTEPAMTFLSAYEATSDGRYRAAAERQLAFAKEMETGEHFLISPTYLVQGSPVIWRDPQARQIYNFFVAYKILGDPQYLAWADDAAEAMLSLERAPHRCGDGIVRSLFATWYVSTSPHDSVAKSGIRSVDLNQNSELGMALVLLYSTPASHLYQSPSALSAARAEILAAMSFQVTSGPYRGALPMTEAPDRICNYDTEYGSYVALLWVITNSYLHDAGLNAAIAGVAAWFTSSGLLAQNTSRWRYETAGCPQSVTPQQASYDEIWNRLALFWSTGVLTYDQRRQWAAYAFPQVQQLPSTVLPSWATPFCYYALLGMPPTEYAPLTE